VILALRKKLKCLLSVSVSLNSVIALLDTDFHCLPTMQQRQQHCPVSGVVVVVHYTVCSTGLQLLICYNGLAYYIIDVPDRLLELLR
jgi:hypothetical protein